MAEQATVWSAKGLELLSNPQGVKVGRTPCEVLYREGKLTLKHYLPQKEERVSTPLLMVYALVNRPYILDLLPGRSVVEHFLKGGIEVYLIDWGIPDEGDRDRTLEEYISGSVHNCVRQAKEAAGTEQVSLFGYCQGGTFSVMYTALYPEQVKNLILLAAPIDFEAEGLLNLWSKKEYFDVDKLVDTYGNIPPSVLNIAFAMLRPIYNTIDKYVQFWWSLAENTTSDEKIELFCAMEKWIWDGISHPGEVFREFVKGCYQENLLIQNRMKLGQRLIDLKKIRCPVLNIVAEGDHIIPPKSSRSFNEVISSKDKTVLSSPSGHVGMTVGTQAQKTLWPKAVNWLVERS
jgi:polyhydroxyalkanoate synthase